MDHPCYKCGHSVEDGKAFCLGCGAPQIRVAMPEAAVLPAAENVLLNALANDVPILPPPLDAPTLSRIEWPRAIRVCAIAAAISIQVMTLRLMVPPLAMLAAGCLAVILYQRRNPTWSMDARRGAQLGALSGLLFFGFSSIFGVLATTLFHAGGELRQKMLEALQQTAARVTDPEVRAYLDSMKTPEGLATMLILFIVLYFLISIAAGVLGGALTGRFFSRRNRL
jgi:hypothetical protein